MLWWLQEVCQTSQHFTTCWWTPWLRESRWRWQKHINYSDSCSHACLNMKHYTIINCSAKACWFHYLLHTWGGRCHGKVNGQIKIVKWIVFYVFHFSQILILIVVDGWSSFQGLYSQKHCGGSASTRLPLQKLLQQVMTSRHCSHIGNETFTLTVLL